jgi:hypothetical protein
MRTGGGAGTSRAAQAALNRPQFRAAGQPARFAAIKSELENLLSSCRARGAAQLEAQVRESSVAASYVEEVVACSQTPGGN